MVARSVGVLVLTGGLLSVGVGCIDPDRSDRALSEVEAVRREAAAREGQVRAMEERQNALNQQMAMLMALATQNLTRDPHREDERDRRLAQINDRVERVEAIVTRIRDEEQPTPIDLAAARRAAEQGSEEERASAVRKVQALLDAGQVKVTMRNGRMQLSLLRPIDAADPYRERHKPAPPAQPKPAAPDKDKLKDLLDSR